MTLIHPSNNLGLKFVIRNVAPRGKKLIVLGTPVANGTTYDLMKIPGVGPDTILESLINGELNHSLNYNEIEIVESTLNTSLINANDPKYASILSMLGNDARNITTQLNWYVDPINGSDTNDGSSELSPLKTLATAATRISGTGTLPRETINVHLLNDQMDDTDSFSPNGLQAPGLGDAGFNVAIRLLGQRTTLEELTMTSAATAPDMTAGTGGEPSKIHVSGFDFSPYVGKHIEILSDTNGGLADGAIAIIVKAPSLGTAWVSPIVNTDWFFPFDELSQPGSGSTFRIYDITKFAPSPAPGFIGAAQMEYHNLDFLPGPETDFPLTTVSFFSCRAQRVIAGTWEGNLGGWMLWQGCSIDMSQVYTAPYPYGWEQIGGHPRFLNCAFFDVVMQNRESSCKALYWFSVFMRSVLTVSGTADELRAAPTEVNVNWWVGFFDWPGPLSDPFAGQLTNGAAIDISKGAKFGVGANIAQFGINSYLYGSSSEANTVGITIDEGGHVLIAESMTTSASPPPLTPSGCAYTPRSLKLTGTLGALSIDGEASHISFDTLKKVLTGVTAPGVGNYTTVSTWSHWENAPFSRNVHSLKTGAKITNAKH